MSKRYCFFRHPQTGNELRANAGADVRAKRNPRHLPTAWDDINRCLQRTWKLYRKTQYKIKEC